MHWIFESNFLWPCIFFIEQGIGWQHGIAKPQVDHSHFCADWFCEFASVKSFDISAQKFQKFPPLSIIYKDPFIDPVFQSITPEVYYAMAISLNIHPVKFKNSWKGDYRINSAGV